MQEDLREALTQFSSGLINCTEVQKRTGMGYEEVLGQLRKWGLSRPIVRTIDRLNAQQRALYDEVFSPPAESPHEDSCE